MKKLLFLDVETTGLNHEDRTCGIAYKCPDENLEVDLLIKPPLPIKLEASMTNHIANYMVEDKPSFDEATGPIKTKELIQDSIMVAHNAKFDIQMLQKEGIIVQDHICTYKVALMLDPTGDRFQRSNLQYLRYFYDIRVKADAHTAMGDVVVLEAVFEKMFDEVVKFDGDFDPVTSVDKAIEKMIEVSKLPAKIPRFQFGKHGPNEDREKGLLITEVASIDPGYLQWLKREKMKEEVLDADWIYTLDEALKNAKAPH